MPWRIAGLAVLCVVGAGPGRSPRYVSGPPPGHTGGFGEPTCQACHTGLPLNDPASTLSLSGLEEGYVPGRTYRVTIRLEGDRYTRRAGFQAAFRFGDGEARGRSAGTLEVDDPALQIVEDSTGRVRYVEHTEAGIDAPDGTRAWTFGWTAPEGGAVTVHVAANAANGDDSPLDDLVYTLARRLGPAAGSPQ